MSVHAVHSIVCEYCIQQIEMQQYPLFKHAFKQPHVHYHQQTGGVIICYETHSHNRAIETEVLPK